MRGYAKWSVGRRESFRNGDDCIGSERMWSTDPTRCRSKAAAALIVMNRRLVQHWCGAPCIAPELIQPCRSSSVLRFRTQKLSQWMRLLDEGEHSVLPQNF